MPPTKKSKLAKPLFQPQFFFREDMLLSRKDARTYITRISYQTAEKSSKPHDGLYSINYSRSRGCVGNLKS